MYRQKEIRSRNTQGIEGYFGNREGEKKKKKKGTLNFPISLTTMNVSPSGDPRKRAKRLTKVSFANASIFMGCPPHSTKKKRILHQKKRKERKRGRNKREKKKVGAKRKKTAADGFSHHPFNCHMVDLSGYQPIIQEKES